MRCPPRLGPTNLALTALYFAPLWGADALRSLRFPYSGFDDRAQAGVLSFVREVFNLGLDGLMQASNVLAGAKLVIAVAFLAYLIEFARALAVGREPDRQTLNVVLALAVIGVMIWAVPAFVLDDGALIRRCATQFLLVAGAVIVVVVERHSLERAQVAPSRDEALTSDATSRPSWTRWGAAGPTTHSASP